MDLLSLPRQKLAADVATIGGKEVHANKIFRALHKLHMDPASFSKIPDMPNKLIAAVSKLKTHRLQVIKKRVSADGTIKYLLGLHDGKQVEAVIIPQSGDKGTKYCVCISSQVGCTMGCSFCATADLKFARNLTAGEIVEQVHLLKDAVKEMEPQRKTVIDSVVFMGMGEPLNNCSNVIDAISILTDHYGYDLSPGKITVSTCGIIPKIKELGEKTKVNLAVSLHAADDATRTKIMPINKTFPLDKLIAACKKYPIYKTKGVMIEYALMKGINDSDADAHALVKLLDFPCIVNLIEYNPVPHKPFMHSTRLKEFQHILINKGIKTFVRKSRGADVAAACGMLAGDKGDVRS